MDLQERLTKVRATGDLMTILLAQLARRSDDRDQRHAADLIRQWDALWADPTADPTDGPANPPPPAPTE